MRLFGITWVTVLLAATAGSCASPAPGPRALVADAQGREVALVDLANGTVEARIEVGFGPHEITLGPDGRTAYVAASGTPDEPGSTITVIDVPGRRARVTFELDDCMPHDLRVGPRSTLWVTCANLRAVAELDAGTGDRRRVWETGVEGGWMLDVAPDGGKIYVANYEGGGVSIIDVRSATVHQIELVEGQIGLAVAPGGGEVWAGGVNEDSIRIMEASSDSVVATIASGGERPVRVRFTPAGDRVLVVNAGSRTVAVFDAARRARLGAIELAHEPKVIAIEPAGDRAIVSHPEAGAVSVLDLERLTVQRVIEVGGAPDGVAWVPGASALVKERQVER